MSTTTRLVISSWKFTTLIFRWIRVDRATKWRAELCEPRSTASRKRSLDIIYARGFGSRSKRARGRHFCFCSRNFFFFCRVIQESSCAKYARDYGFIFLGNLPCRFYECPVTANVSYKRWWFSLTEPVQRMRYRYRAIAYAFMALLFCFRHFSLSLCCRASRDYRNDIVNNRWRLFFCYTLPLCRRQPAFSLIFSARVFLFIEAHFVES